MDINFNINLAIYHFVWLGICDVYVDSSINNMETHGSMYSMNSPIIRQYDIINGFKNPELVYMTLNGMNNPSTL
jgi:formylmethanofuran dehydrogenase subunit B